MVLTQLLDLEGLDLRSAVSAIAISSSSPMATRNCVEWRIAGSRRSISRSSDRGPNGHAILYDNPREVGPDRIADAVGAYDLYPGRPSSSTSDRDGL